MCKRILLLIICVLLLLTVSSCGADIKVNGGEGFGGKITVKDGRFGFDGMYAGDSMQDIGRVLKNKRAVYYMQGDDYLRVERGDNNYTILMQFDKSEMTLRNMAVTLDVELPDAEYPTNDEKSAKYDEEFSLLFSQLEEAFGEVFMTDIKGYGTDYLWVVNEDGEFLSPLTPDDEIWEEAWQKNTACISLSRITKDYMGWPEYYGEVSEQLNEKNQSVPYSFSEKEHITVTISNGPETKKNIESVYDLMNSYYENK